MQAASVAEPKNSGQSPPCLEIAREALAAVPVGYRSGICWRAQHFGRIEPAAYRVPARSHAQRTGGFAFGARRFGPNYFGDDARPRWHRSFVAAGVGMDAFCVIARHHRRHQRGAEKLGLEPRAAGRSAERLVVGKKNILRIGPFLPASSFP